MLLRRRRVVVCPSLVRVATLDGKKEGEVSLFSSSTLCLLFPLRLGRTNFLFNVGLEWPRAQERGVCQNAAFLLIL